ncbi:hypothetical protein AeNC1_016263 [Aphanomyces euteiches]|nr:hypothetical protein AeNC1_016263 [Aphanomyces euteiches]
MQFHAPPKQPLPPPLRFHLLLHCLVNQRKPHGTFVPATDTRKKGECHYCGKEGHWKTECRKRMADHHKKSQEMGNQASDEDYMFAVDFWDEPLVKNHQSSSKQDIRDEFMLSAYEESHARYGGDFSEDGGEEHLPPQVDNKDRNVGPSDPGHTSNDTQYGSAYNRPTTAISIRGVPAEVTLANMTDTLVAHDIPKLGETQFHFALSILEEHTHRIIIDSGASSHMTGDRTNLQDINPCNKRVVVADGKTTVAKICDTMKIKTKVGTNISLIDVLYIEGMPTTLLSIPALMRSALNASIKFEKTSAQSTME